MMRWQVFNSGRTDALVFLSRHVAETRVIQDTDSVLYIQPRDGAALVKTGDSIGDMTLELRPCEYISEYVSGWPKNYAYRMRNTGTGVESTVCKMRGVTLK